MVTCVVTECRSGYKLKKAEQNDDRGTKEKMHWHKFVIIYENCEYIITNQTRRIIEENNKI